MTTVTTSYWPADTSMPVRETTVGGVLRAAAAAGPGMLVPDDIAQIQYTSGTTGFPKGAELTHRGLTNNARFYAERIELAPGEVYVNPMPLFHTAGCAMGVLGTAQSLAAHVPVLAFDPALVLELLEAERAAAFLGVPTMMIATGGPVPVGQVGELCARGGENIYPREIEEVLFGHPAVAEVAVLGIPDQTWGEAVAAFVRPAPGLPPPAPEELRAHCREHLAPYKTPAHWVFVDAFPMTPSGKIQKYKLRETFARQEPAQPQPG